MNKKSPKVAQPVSLEKIAEGRSNALALAEAYTCASDDDLMAGRDLMNGCKNARDTIKAFFKPLKQKQDEVKRNLLDTEREHLESAEKPLGIIEGKMKTYVQEREEKEREARRKAEEIRQKAEREQQRRDEEASRKAAELAKKGKAAQAREVLAQNDRTVVSIPTAPPPPEPIREVKGLSTGKKWTAQVTNLKALCKAIGEGRASMGYVKVNQSALDGMARSMKNEDLDIPGVVGVSETSIGSRR